MKRIALNTLLVSTLCLTAACTQNPVDVSYRGKQFFGPDTQQFASAAASGDYRAQAYRSSYHAPAAVNKVASRELRPIQRENASAWSQHDSREPTDTVRWNEWRPEPSEPMAAIAPRERSISTAELKPLAAPAMTANATEAQPTDALTQRPATTVVSMMATPRPRPAAPAMKTPAAIKQQDWSKQGAVLPSAPMGAIALKNNAGSGAPSFIWPVRGEVISGFGPKEGGERNDGINIAAPEGEPIFAAADGAVVYAGNELPGYGNMIILRHQDGWMTAYAHAGGLMVKKDEKVQQGDLIGYVGATGSVKTAQLHFGLREGANPVDPAGYLRRDMAGLN